MELRRGRTDAALRLADEAVAHAQRMAAGFEHSAWLGHALLTQALARRAASNQAGANDAATLALRELLATLDEASPLLFEARALVAATGG